jgi:hypothetical protein
MTQEELNSIKLAAFFETVKMANSDQGLLGATGKTLWANKKALALLAAGGIGHQYASNALEAYRLGKQVQQSQMGQEY